MKHLEHTGKSACVICAVSTAKLPTPVISVKGDDVDLLSMFSAITEYLMVNRHFTSLDIWAVVDDVTSPYPLK